MVNQALKFVQNWAVSGRYDRLDLVSGITTREDTTVLTATSATLVSGTVSNLVSTYDVFNAGSPWSGQGKVFRDSSYIAGAIISGGMWVIGSDTKTIIPAPAGTRAPMGICIGNTGSKAVPTVLVNGFYYAPANGDVAIGDPIGQGGGAALNGVITDTVGSMTRGLCMETVASGTAAKALIYLW